MTEWIVFALLILGALFTLISVIGLLRLPDLFMRMHATTKTTSIGIILLIAAVIIAQPDIATIIKGILIIIFTFLTVPLGSHMISKAGNKLNIKKWNNYKRDDLNNQV